MLNFFTIIRPGVWLVLTSMAAFAQAQVPELITYHGRVQSEGVDVNGTARFKFAIVETQKSSSVQATAVATLSDGQIVDVFLTDPGDGYVMNPVVTITDPTGSGAEIRANVARGSVDSLILVSQGRNYTSPSITIEPPPMIDEYVTHWSNDASSIAGSEPVESVELPVTGGLFTVVLGQGMSRISPLIFANPELHLRVWVEADGTGGQSLASGFEQLVPDQLLTTTPFSMMASQVQAGGVTGDMIAPGAVDVVHLSQAAQSGVANVVDHLELGDEDDYGSLRIYHNDQGEPALWLDGEAGRISAFGVGTQEMFNLTGRDYGHLSLFNQIDGNARAVLTSVNELVVAPDEGGGALYLYAPDGFQSSNLEARDDGGRLTLHGPGPLFDRSEARLSSPANGGTLELFNADNESRVRLEGLNGGGLLTLLGEQDQLNAVLAGEEDSNGGALGLYNDAGQLTLEARGHPGMLTLSQSDASMSLTLTQGPGGGMLNTFDENGTLTASVGSAGSGGEALFYQPDGVTPGVVVDGNATGFQGGRIRVNRPNGNFSVSLNAGSSSTGGSVTIRKPDGTTAISLEADDSDGNGRIVTQVLQITGGSDFSEQFKISHDLGVVEPGMVVSIDPRSPGELVVSDQAYDRTVAGVVSGAGGVRPGMLMSQSGTIADGDHAVALTGRVYCRVDAEFGAIEPGDLLTTSVTPGHAMKVTDHTRAPGSVIGKAMTSLISGKGLVLVLVNLQ